MESVRQPHQIPDGTSWIYELTAAAAVEQCTVLGIDPQGTLEANRALLRAYIAKLRQELLLDGAAVTSAPTTHTLTPSSGPTLSQTTPANTTGDHKAPCLQLHVTYNHDTIVTDSPAYIAPGYIPNVTLTPGAPASSQAAAGHFTTCARCVTTQALPAHPISFPATSETWGSAFHHAAAAIGASIASALADHGSEHSRVTPTARLPPIISDLIARLPIVHGADTGKLVNFLVEIKKINKLKLTNVQAVVLHCLPKTSGQLRALWAQAIEQGDTWDVLEGTILDFFVPRRLRQAAVAELVYRSQRLSEPLVDFIMTIQDNASVLAPELQDHDILEVIITGMNQTTRARMGGFPPPTSVPQLIALVPNLEVVRRLEAVAVDTSRQTSGAYRAPWGNSNDGRYNRPVSGYRGDTNDLQRRSGNRYRAPFVPRGAAANPRYAPPTAHPGTDAQPTRGAYFPGPRGQTAQGRNPPRPSGNNHTGNERWGQR